MNHDDIETDRSLCITFSGGSECLTVGRNVIRALMRPAYICFRVSKDRHSLIVYGCNSKDLMSFKVPSRIFEGKQHSVRVYSKAFVLDLIDKNDLDPNTNYMVPGKNLEDKKVVLFDLKDALKHNKGFIEEIDKAEASD